MKKIILLFGLALTGCETVRDRAASGVGTLIDCEAPNIKASVAELVPLASQAIKSWISGDGKVDTAKMRAACAGIVGDLGRCVMASAVAILANPAPVGLTVIAQPLAVPDPGALRAAFESVRSDWGGAAYKTSAGTL